MKFRLLWALSCFSVAILFAADPNILSRGHQTLLLIWEDAMQKPPPKRIPIKASELKNLAGTWKGSGKSFSDPITIELQIIADGTWSSDFRPEMKEGRWYLHEGMIQLWSGEASGQKMPETCIVQIHEGTVLFFAEDPTGYIILKKL